MNAVSSISSVFVLAVVATASISDYYRPPPIPNISDYTYRPSVSNRAEDAANRAHAHLHKIILQTEAELKYFTAMATRNQTEFFNVVFEHMITTFDHMLEHAVEKQTHLVTGYLKGNFEKLFRDNLQELKQDLFEDIRKLKSSCMSSKINNDDAKTLQDLNEWTFGENENLVEMIDEIQRKLAVDKEE